VQMIYTQAYRDDSYLRWMCRQTLDNHGSSRCWDGYLSYDVEGTLSDGDMDTSLVGNVLSVAMLWTWVRHVGITKWRFIVNGDDAGVFIESRDYTRFVTGMKAWFHDLGFRTKVEPPVYEIEHIEFCQSHPIFDGNKYIMVRRYPSALSKQCRSLVALRNEADFDAYWSCVGEGGLSQNGGIPIYQDFFRSLVRKSKSRFFRGAVEGVWSPHLLCGRVYGPVHPACRSSFYNAFGVTPDEQVATEEYYHKTLYGFTVASPIDKITPYPILL